MPSLPAVRITRSAEEALSGSSNRSSWGESSWPLANREDLSSLAYYVFGSDDRNAAESCDITVIEGKKLTQFVTQHGRNESCSMGPLALHIMLPNQLPPGLEHVSLVAKQRENVKPVVNGSVHIAGRHAKTVTGERACCHHPVFVNNLRHQAKLVATVLKLENRFLGNSVVRVPLLSKPGKNVRVKKNSHSPRPS